MNEMMPTCPPQHEVRRRIERIESKIYVISGQKVMLDRDLASLYGVETKQLKRQVKRNLERFPEAYMFQLTLGEYQILRRQFGTLSWGEHAKYLPYAFTEHGVAMLSAVLNSRQAIKVSIMIINTFIRLRHSLIGHNELARQVAALEKITGKHDIEIGGIIKLLKKLMEPVRTEVIGFELRNK